MNQCDASISLRDVLNGCGVTKDDVMKALDVLPRSTVLVVGDLIIDRYTYCTAIGKTSKTPTLAVKRGRTDQFWGGSGLFAKHLVGLGATVEYVTVCGADWGADFVREGGRMERLRLHLFIDDSRPTTVKERFWVDGDRLLEVQTVENAHVDPALCRQIDERVDSLLDGCDLVLISDPGHGLMSPELIDTVKQMCMAHGTPLVADAQLGPGTGRMTSYLEEYDGVDMICANEAEARFVVRDDRGDIENIVSKLYDVTRVKRLVVKRGPRGVVGFDERERWFEMPGIQVEAKDPVGSGDAFLSAAALTYRADVPLMTSMFVATCAGALSVTKMGTVPNTGVELRAFVEQHIRDAL